MASRTQFLLAESFKAERLIIDDLEGRREAVHRGLTVIGTLGLLAEAARRNLLDLPQALADLQATNFGLPANGRPVRLDYRSDIQDRPPVHWGRVDSY